MHREGSDEPPARSEPAAIAGGPGEEVSGVTPEDRLHLRELQKERRSRVVKALVALVLAVLLIIFIIANSQPETVNFVFFEREVGLIWIMFGCAVLGGLVGFLIGKPGKQVRLHRRPKKPPDPKGR